MFRNIMRRHRSLSTTTATLVAGALVAAGHGVVTAFDDPLRSCWFGLGGAFGALVLEIYRAYYPLDAPRHEEPEDPGG